MMMMMMMVMVMVMVIVICARVKKWIGYYDNHYIQ